MKRIHKEDLKGYLKRAKEYLRQKKEWLKLKSVERKEKREA